MKMNNSSTRFQNADSTIEVIPGRPKGNLKRVDKIHQ